MISNEDVKKTADLARIELDADEMQALQKDLDRILDYVGQLKEVNTDGVEEASATGFNEFRPDEAERFDDVAALMRAAPHTDRGFISVKKVIEK